MAYSGKAALVETKRMYVTAFCVCDICEVCIIGLHQLRLLDAERVAGMRTLCCICGMRASDVYLHFVGS